MLNGYKSKANNIVLIVLYLIFEGGETLFGYICRNLH